MLLDLHTHILPHIDDGAKSSEESREMLLEIRRQEMEPVVLTPHFYPYEQSLDDFLAKRNRCYEELKSTCGELTPGLLGAEIYLSPLLLKNEELRRLCIGNSNYTLVELPFTPKIDEKILRVIDVLRYDYGMIPVIAHVERYPAIRSDHGLLEKFVSEGCMIQVNAGAFLTSPIKRKFAFHLLKEEIIDFLGTDCHNLDSRSPNLSQALEVIEKKKLGHALQKLYSRSETLYQMALDK